MFNINNMYQSIINIIKSIKNYINTIIYGDEETQNLKIIYKENGINLDKLYSRLKKIEPKLCYQNNINEIIFFLKKEIEYDNKLNDYEKISDINLDINDQIRRIERTTHLKHLKENFEKIKIIKDEYRINISSNKKND